jgi:hypothetical protein
VDRQSWCLRKSLVLLISSKKELKKEYVGFDIEYGYVSFAEGRKLKESVCNSLQSEAIEPLSRSNTGICFRIPFGALV